MGAIALVGSAIAPTVAAAQAPLTVADLGLTASAGFGGQAVRYQWMPVTVRLAPTSLFSGTVEVTTSNGVSEVRQVEVAGNAVKEFTFVVPSGSVRIRAIPDGSDQAVQIRPDVDGRPNGALVGLPSTDGRVPAGLPQVELVATDERVVWVPANPALLDMTHLSMTSLATLVLAPDDIADLTDAGRANLQRAVLDGLNLVLVAAPGTIDLDLSSLPPLPAVRVETPVGRGTPTVVPGREAFTLTSADALPDPGEFGMDGTEPIAASVPAGYGRVVVTGIEPIGTGAPTAWEHLAAQRDASHRLDGEHTNLGGGWIAQQAVSSGGALDVPSLRLLALFAVAYLLVAGPGNALLLRRLGRRELGWVTVPAITVAFVGIAFVVASGTQPKVGVVGGAVAWSDGLGTELTITAVRAPAAGAHDIVLPGPDWVVQGTADFGVGTSTVDRASGDTRAALQLQALQVGMVIARRPTTEAAPLNVQVTPSGKDQVDVQVTNLTTRSLADVQVRLGGVRQSIGDLGPGANGVATVSTRQLHQLDVYVDVFQDARRFDGSLEAPASLRAMLSGTSLADRPGRVVVVADDPDAPTQIRADGEATQSIGRVVAVEVPFTGVGNVAPAEIDRALLVGAFTDGWQPSPHAVEGQLTAYLRYRLPGRAAGQVDRVVPDVARGEGWIEGMGQIGGIGIPEPLPNQGQCLVVEDRLPDGSVGSSTSCGDVDLDPPACPQDAVSCEFGPDFWFFEFEDGRSQTGRIEFGGNFDQPVPIQPRGGGQAHDFLEVYDHATGRWDGLAGVKVLRASHVSAMGEVHLRISGGLFPFDYSARGLSVELKGVAA